MLFSVEVVSLGAPGYYNKVLRNSGYSDKITHEITTGNIQRKNSNRKRYILWYNPVFILATKVNISSDYL